MKIKEITLSAVFIAIALIVYIIENQFIPPVPIPYVKIGIANVITLITLVLWDRKHSFIILMSRIIISAFLCGSGVSLLYSASGGMACFFAMSIFFRLFGRRFVTIASEIGAAFHCAGQLAAAAVVLRSISVFAYFPIMLAVGAVSSLIVGVCAKYICKNRFIRKLFEM